MNGFKNSIISVLKISAIIITICVVIAMIISAYSGFVNPLKRSYFGILTMIFPILAIANFISLCFWLILKKWKVALIPFIAFIACIGPLTTYIPFSLGSKQITAEEAEKSFTLMTYNVMHFADFESKESSYNRTIKYILDTDADVVCLQECERITPIRTYNVSKKDTRALKERYPYYKEGKDAPGRRDITFLSKYPIKKPQIKAPKMSKGSMDACSITINGVPITVVNLHLESIGLTKTDKELYMELTSIKNAEADIQGAKETAKKVHRNLFAKLNEAFRNRARQSQEIREYLDKIEGDVIVCGDFNDVPGSYSYRIVKGDMKDAYNETSFWPTITYHDNRFYFKIDQIFYTGNLEAVKVIRGNVKYSDHYPLIATFITTSEQ